MADAGGVLPYLSCQDGTFIVQELQICTNNLCFSINEESLWQVRAILPGDVPPLYYLPLNQWPATSG